MALLVKKYPVFEDNQVLTSSQLNNLVEYLDEQNRMTRVALIGVGIACGLEIKCESSDGGDSLTISKGVGVTSEGYLVKMCGDCVMTRVRPYIKLESVDYDPFEDAAGIQDIVLHELLSADAETDPTDDVQDFNKEEYEDYAVLLYIECFDKDLKSCLGKSCDELGIDRFLNLRKLLISSSDLVKVLERTEGGYQDIDFSDQFTLPQVIMPRSLFKAGSPESENYGMYVFNFVSSVSSIYSELIAALTESYNAYEPALGPIYGENPFESAVFQNIQNEWISYATGGDGSPLQLLGVQYFYDFIKDLILAYIEFRDNACDLLSLCCPDTDRFPKHLILGILDQTEVNGTTSEARHGFTQTPIYGNQKGLLAHVVKLHQKIVLLIESFDLDRLRIPKEKELTTKVTPSCEKKSYLSDRTIPFYQDISKSSQFGLTGTLEELWRGNNKPRLGRNVLSYDKHLPFELPIDEVTTPLDFDLDAYDFLRIEGHVGQHVKEVMEQLESIKSQKNLEFEVKPVYLGSKGLELGYPECLCSDIQPDYSIWRNKTLYFLKTVLSITTLLGNLIDKKDSLSDAFLTSFRSESKSETIANSFNDASDFAKKKSTTRSDFNPISVNPVKFSNISDIGLNVNSNNWEYAGHQVINSFDNIAQAEKKATNNKASLATNNLSTNAIISEYLNIFNDCLCKLIDSMKVDLKEFDLEEWKKHYSCMYDVHIDIMKRIGSGATNSKASLQAYVIIIIYCLFYQALCFLGIWPYITVGVLTDTLKFRKEKFQEALKFSNFLKTQPGVDHKAGVPPGGTFLLLYLSKLESEIGTSEMFDNIFEGGKGSRDSQNLFEGLKERLEEIDIVHEQFEGMVVGDFTLNGACCDDCGDMPNAALTLDPLGLPICGTVIPITDQEETNNSTFFNEYRPLNKKMISHVYDRENYRTRNTSVPKHGTLKFDLVASSFEVNIVDGRKGEPKKIERMTYTVNTQSVEEFHKSFPNVGILTDEFNYEIYDITRNNEVVCQNKVTIFIPIISKDFDQEPELAEVVGNVVEKSANGPPIFDATVKVLSANVDEVKTNDDGTFILSDVPFGNYILSVSKPGFITKEVTIDVKSTSTDAKTIILISQDVIIDLTVDLRDLFKEIKVKEGSTESIRIAKNYVNKSKANDTLMKKLINEGSIDVRPTLEASAVTINEFSKSNDLKVARLNKEFSARRDELTEVFQSVDGKEKKIFSSAIETLTTSYFDRLSIAQPKTLSTTSVKTLKETTIAFNKAKDLSMKAVVAKWVRNERGNVSTNFTNSLKLNLKINR